VDPLQKTNPPTGKENLPACVCPAKEDLSTSDNYKNKLSNFRFVGNPFTWDKQIARLGQNGEYTPI
jgi:hypothetical protein